MTHHSITVQAEWDDEAKVFVATSEDVPGLVAEAASLPELTAKLAILIPELLELNGGKDDAEAMGEDVPMILLSQQVTRLRLHS